MISARPRLPGQFCGPTSPAARGTAGSRRFRRSARRARSATSFGRRRPTSTSPIYGLPVLKANDHIANTAVQKGRQGARALLGRRGAVRSNERQPRLPRLGGWAGRSKINRRCSGFNRSRRGPGALRRIDAATASRIVRGAHEPSASSWPRPRGETPHRSRSAFFGP